MSTTDLRLCRTETEEPCRTRAEEPCRTNIEEIPPISLAELNAAAALQTRIDRKYIVDDAHVSPLIHAMAGTSSALEIDGQRSFGYQSVYFDTAERDSYFDALRGRRRRFKVRTRTYLDSGLCMLETKVRGAGDATVKVRTPHNLALRHSLDDTALEFIESQIPRPELAKRLQRALVTEYDRVTLIDRASNSRVTIDSNLRCHDFCGNQVLLDNRVVIETKSGGQTNGADLWLWRAGIRPTKISKFATSCAALDPSLPSNKWTRTLRHHFSTTTVQEPIAL